MNKKVTILHISDLHFDSTDTVEWNILFSFLKSDIQKRYMIENIDIPNPYYHLNAPNIIVISGDLSTNGSDYENVEKFLLKLSHTFLNGDCRKIIIVPGNHDIDWNISKKCYSNIKFNEDDYNKSKTAYSNIRFKRVGQEIKLFKKNRISYRSRFDNFIKLFNKFYNSYYTYPTDLNTEYTIHKFEEFGIIIVGFNSCIGVDHLNNIPFFERKAIISCAEVLDSDDKLKNLTRIAVWHHGAVTNNSTIDNLDNSKTKEILLSCNFSLLLHGHMHESQYTQQMSDTGEYIPFIGAGSLGANQFDRPESIPFQYNLVKLDLLHNTGYINARRRASKDKPWLADYNNNQGDPYHDISLPLKLDDQIMFKTNGIGDFKSKKNGKYGSAPIIDLMGSLPHKNNLTELCKKVLHDRYGLRDPRFIFGRNHDIIKLFQQLILAEENVYIHGPLWSGKTTLLQSLQSEHIHSWVNSTGKINIDIENTHFIYLEMRNLNSPKNVFNEISSKISKILDSVKDSDSFSTLIEKIKEQNKRLILLMNHFDSILENSNFESKFFNMMRTKSSNPYLKIVYTRTLGRKISPHAYTKSEYFMASPYKILFLPKESIIDFINIPLKILGVKKTNDYLPQIEFLGGRHPYFLSIARRIAFEVITEKGSDKFDAISEKIENQFEGEVINLYDSLLAKLTKFEFKWLFEQFQSKGQSRLLPNIIRSFGYFEDNKLNAFSQHFNDYFINVYYRGLDI